MRSNVFYFAAFCPKYRRNNVGSLEFPATLYVHDFNAAQSSAVFPDKEFVNTALIDVNPLLKRNFL